MVDRISEDDFKKEMEKVTVEVLSSKKFPREEDFDRPVSDNIEENYRNLILKMTKRVNVVLDNEWAELRSVSGHSMKLVKNLSRMYKDMLEFEEGKRLNGKADTDTFKLSHSHIQQKLRELENLEKRNE